MPHDIRTVLPDGFKEWMGRLLGAAEAGELFEALDRSPVIGIRRNPLKDAGFSFDETGRPIPWCRYGIVLSGERPRFIGMPSWHAGHFYVQEPASQVICHVVEHLTGLLGNRPLRYLDACAAPGGKTTCALSTLPQGSMVVANEFVPSRAATLKENIQRWGEPGVIVTQGDTARLRKLKGAFDIVAVDAPCSGEGMMRRTDNARKQWSEGLVRQCAYLQQEIVDNAWEALAPGGYLIYSTCTFNDTENEGMVRRILEKYGAECVEIPMPDGCGVSPALDKGIKGMRFMPHRTPGEGLFMSVMRKPEGEVRPSLDAKSKKGKPSKGTPDGISDWLENKDEYFLRKSGSSAWNAFPIMHAPLLDAVERVANVIYAGMEIAYLKGRDHIPAQALAWSPGLRSDAFPIVEVNRHTATQFISGNSLTLENGTPRGVVLLRHEGCNLGFVKNLGNRANNLYPPGMRIKK